MTTESDTFFLHVTIDGSNQRMTALLQELAVTEGTHQTALDEVKLIRVSSPIPRRPVLYEPSIVIVGQGTKRAYLGDGVYLYDTHNYLVVSVPLAFECETVARPKQPMLAMSIAARLATLGEMLTKMDSVDRQESLVAPCGIYSTRLNGKLSQTVVRLLECLQDPVETRVLGPGIVREIMYHVLCGEQGATLRAVAVHGRLGQVGRALARINAEFARDLSVKDLADSVGMSASAFHHAFKIMTSMSPLQYLKTIRLHKARMLMMYEGVGVSAAAERVGYQSASQFSREFKRLFGVSPVENVSRATRTKLGVSALSFHSP